jgi:hypothetical protein
MALPYMMVSRVLHPCKVVVLVVLLCNLIEQMVPPCIVIEGIVVLESWGLRIDRAKFCSEECPSD